jgi:hypothetical protein
MPPSRLPTQPYSQRATVQRPPAHVSLSSPSPSQLLRALTSSTDQATGRLGLWAARLTLVVQNPPKLILVSPRNILGQLDCSISQSPQTAACAWTVGSYPSSEVANLAKSWITTPAASSVTILPTITDISSQSSQAFVNVAYQEDYYVTLWSGSPARGAGLAVIWAVVAAVMSVLSVIMLF